MMSEDNKADVVILTALPLEKEAVLAHIDISTTVHIGGRDYSKTRIGKHDVVVSCAFGMGNVNSGIAATEAINAWRPSHIFLVGYAGGVKQKNERYLGDVLIGDQIVDYELAKVTPAGTERRFRVYPAAHVLLTACKTASPMAWASSIRISRPDGTSGRVNPLLHVGTIASGQKVVTDPEVVEDLKSVWSQLSGVEMEANGVASAAHQSVPPTGFLVIKGISDWADPSKEDGWQHYAADAAAAFAVCLLESNTFSTPTETLLRGTSPDIMFNGQLKITICRRLTTDWKDLADYFSIPTHDRDRFEIGRGAAGVWEWLEARSRLSELVRGLDAIGRSDLAGDLKLDPR